MHDLLHMMTQFLAKVGPYIFPFALVFIFFPLALRIFHIGYKQCTKSRGWSKVKGTIFYTEANWRREQPLPSVRYKVDGHIYEHESQMGQNPPLRKGKQVTVLYDPDNPTEAIINTLGQRGFPFIIIGAMFTVILTVVAYMIYGNKVL